MVLNLLPHQTKSPFFSRLFAVLVFVSTFDVSVTSSTAQGGGRSFKNRKPIGEVGCCDHRWQSEATDGLKGD